MNIKKTKDYPESIFKYCHLKNKNHVDNLIKNKIWLSNPLTFNDPYDCSITFNAEKINTIMVNNEISNILDSFPEDEIPTSVKTQIISSSNPKNKLLSTIEKIITTKEGLEELNYINGILRPKINREVIENFNQLYKSKLKVSSFSENNLSMLMWGHYADSHQGFCIEYDIKSMPEEENIKKYLFPIEYTDTIYDITQFYIDNVINKNQLDINSLIKSVLYKSKEWSYEKEWRFVITNSECSDNTISTPKPKAIYLGSKIDKSHKKQFIELCKKNDIPISYMQLNNKYFKIESKAIE